MSAIRERTVLCAIDLPKKLTSRRNLHGHFSKFGQVKNVSVNKDLRSGIIQFASHFDAQAAKTQGILYDDLQLNIFWSDATSLDPRAREKHDYEVPETEPLWLDDDKECFGVESITTTTRDEHKKSAKDMIAQHLKLSSTKKRLGTSAKCGEVRKPEILVSQRSPTKLAKVGPKTLVTLKKSLLTHGNKRKLIRKEGEIGHSVSSSKQNTSILQNQTLKSSASSTLERTDLKHKLALLDERDKLIRKETVQDSNIKTAVAIKGKCPDMCPERERILRQCGHAVATYEMLPGTNEMDESRAVKEYIRSSADQEVPLPHDLRPEPVLSMTMNYLITNIINKIDNPDENKAVWYSFCWNRLRSVRKDIILQQLCDMETVMIVEQCARFHISCYDHMWGAEVSGFDDKINTQNLIDCLQTLRHMYEDLAKHNVNCSNEPEFYSYLILLKLKSGDVMWEYQQYSLEIQLSPHIQFAIEAYTAFKNNMYSRYFNLVKRAPYLTACLMQRYFDEVRTRALRTMLKAYCLPGKTVGLSCSFIVSSLKFDSQKNALRFCEREEVDVKADWEGNEQDVYVSTSSFLIREKRLPIANAVVGESNPLPLFIPHQVHSSFDEYGKLKNSQGLPVVSDEDVFYSSEESRYSEEEKSEVNIPEVNIQQPAFKFSLSPSKVPENIFDNTPSRVTLDHKKLTDESLMKQELSQFNKSNTDSKVLFSPSKHYEDRSLESVEMEQDLEQDMTYVDNEIQQGLVHEKVQTLFTSQTSPSRMTQLGFQQPFLVPSVASTKTPGVSFQGEENKVPNFFQDHNFILKDVKVAETTEERKNEEKSIFSFTLAKNELTESLPKDHIHNINELNTVIVSETGISSFKFEMLGRDSKEHEKPPDHMDVDIKMDVQFSSNELKQSDLKVVRKETSKEWKKYLTTEDIETTNKALQHEIILREKANEERLKLEESKRVEMEKLKKKIEEQRVLPSLKKYVSERLKFINARKHARKWKEKVEKLKKTRADFPALVQLSVNKHLSLWGEINFVPTNSIFQRAKDKRNSDRVISQLLQSGITDSCRYIGSDLAEALAKSAARTMNKGVVKPVYWKLGISVPWTNRATSELSVFNQLMKRWCSQSFYRSADTHVGAVESVMTSLEIPVNISIHFSDDFESSHDLQGMNALVFVVLNESETEQMCLERLRTLATSEVKSGEFSVAVMNIGGSKLEQVIKMELEELHEQNLVSHWTVNTWSSSISIVESLNFLTEHVSVVPHICTSPLGLLVKQVSQEFFDALSSGQHLCVGLENAVKNPNNVIYLYNSCLNKVHDLLMSGKLEKYFSFAEEFKLRIPLNESGGPELMCGKQYDEVYKSQVSKMINSSKLPEFSKWPVKSPNRLVKMLKTYCTQVHDISIFPQIIRMLDLPDDADLLEHLEHVSWLNIVEIWAQCSVRHTFSAKEKSTRMFVIFNKNDVQRMIKKQWWLKLPMIVQLDKC